MLSCYNVAKMLVLRLILVHSIDNVDMTRHNIRLQYYLLLHQSSSRKVKQEVTME